MLNYKQSKVKKKTLCFLDPTKNFLSNKYLVTSMQVQVQVTIVT